MDKRTKGKSAGDSPPPPSSLQLRLYTEHLRWRKVAVSVLHRVVCGGDAGSAHHPEIRDKIVGGGGERGADAKRALYLCGCERITPHARQVVHVGASPDSPPVHVGSSGERISRLSVCKAERVGGGASIVAMRTQRLLDDGTAIVFLSGVKSVTLSKGSGKERTKRWEMTKIGRGGGRSMVRSSVYNTYRGGGKVGEG